jgi:hypothetical protein
MPDSDSLKLNKPRGSKYVPPTAVRVSASRWGQPVSSLQFKRLGREDEVRCSRRGDKCASWFQQYWVQSQP